MTPLKNEKEDETETDNKQLKQRQTKINRKAKNQITEITEENETTKIRMIKKVTAYIFLFTLALISIVSCDEKRVFDEYKAIPNAKWNSQEKMMFSFQVKDTLAKQNLFINLRNNNDYEFSNLFLITQMDFPNGHKIIDTLEYDMTDKTGRFLGSGFSETKENKLFYKENIAFPTVGNYTFFVSQAMRKNGEAEGVKHLNGITEIGFRIEKIK